MYIIKKKKKKIEWRKAHYSKTNYGPFLFELQTLVFLCLSPVFDAFFGARRRMEFKFRFSFVALIQISAFDYTFIVSFKFFIL